MADLADGTYNVVTSLDTGKVIDCMGGSEMSGTNVTIHHRNNSDAQLVHVTTIGTYRKLTFAQSGKSLDVYGSLFHDGDNVQEWDDNGTTAQRWNIVSDGGSVTIDGTSYETYVIKCAANTAFALDVTNGQAAENTNVQIYSVNGTNAQRWAFLPMNPIPTGTYIIHSALDYKCVLDVSGASTSSGANVQLYGKNGTNAQIFRVLNYSDTGLAKIANANSGMFLNVDGNLAENGRNVQQWTDDGTDANLWLIEPCGHMTVDGNVRDTYRIDFKTSHGYVMDAAGGQTTPKTNVQIYLYNDSLAQNWFFEPYSFLTTDLPTPADVLVNDSTQIEYTTEKIYPSWICDGTEYQCRYRIRRRKTGSTIDSWSSWMSIYDGSTANDGWGDVGIANCTTNDTERKKSAYGINCPVVDNSTYDYAEVEFEVRRFTSTYNDTTGLCAHSYSTSQVISVVQKAVVTVSHIFWSAAGLTIEYSSSYQSSGNTIAIENVTAGGKTLCGLYYASGLPYSGVLTIPIENLYFVPDNGAALSASIKLTTATASTSETSITGVVQYNESYGVLISPTYIPSMEDYCINARLEKHEHDYCYLKVKTPTGYVFKPCDQTKEENGYRFFKICPPLNVDFTVCWVSISADGTWGTKNDTMDSISSKWYIWNWDDNCCVLCFGEGESPSQEDNNTPDSEKLVTSGREYPLIHFGESSERDLSIDGVYLDNFIPNDDRDAFQRLKLAHHAIFRSPYDGEWHRVAITNVSIKRSTKIDGYGTVSIKQEAETL